MTAGYHLQARCIVTRKETQSICQVPWSGLRDGYPDAWLLIENKCVMWSGKNQARTPPGSPPGGGRALPHLANPFPALLALTSAGRWHISRVARLAGKG